MRERNPGERCERAEDAIVVGAAEPVELILAGLLLPRDAFLLCLPCELFGGRFGGRCRQFFNQIFERRNIFVHANLP